MISDFYCFLNPEDCYLMEHKYTLCASATITFHSLIIYSAQITVYGIQIECSIFKMEMKM